MEFVLSQDGNALLPLDGEGDFVSFDGMGILSVVDSVVSPAGSFLS